jgi:hypothetical protein
MLLVSEVTRAPQNGHEFQYLVHITSTVLVFSSYLVRLECFITNVFVYHHQCVVCHRHQVCDLEKQKNRQNGFGSDMFRKQIGNQNCQSWF